LVSSLPYKNVLNTIISAELVECWLYLFCEDNIGFLNDKVKRPYDQQLKKVFSDLENYNIIHIYYRMEPFYHNIINIYRFIIWINYRFLNLPDKADILKYIYCHYSVKITAILDL